jgi:hypothetical protein
MAVIAYRASAKHVTLPLRLSCCYRCRLGRFRLDHERAQEMNNFKASVQYGDWNGTAAADEADQISLSRYLEKNGLVKDEEFLVASSIFIGENHGGKIGGVYITAYLFTPPPNTTVDVALDAITGPIPVRELELEITLDEYVGFFKRFKVFHTKRYLNLEGREYEAI